MYNDVRLDVHRQERSVREATFTEFRNQARHYFDLVEAGETVRVLRNGKAIAEIRPMAPAVPSWKRRAADPLELRGATLSQLVLAERAD
jgi:antitoxin (DNA-binding transcriptional repressor) of toxin-antitoxin stability system